MKVNVEREGPDEPNVLWLMPGRKKAPSSGLPFNKMYGVNLDVLWCKVSPEAGHLFIWLACRLVWHTNAVADRDGVIVTVRYIVDNYGRQLKQRRVIELVNELVTIGYLSREKVGTNNKFRINPNLFYFGEYPDETLVDTFAATSKSYIKKGKDTKKPRKHAVNKDSSLSDTCTHSAPIDALPAH